MKKFLVFVLLWVVIVSFILIRNTFFVDKKDKENQSKQEKIVAQENIEHKDETDFTQAEGVYKVLDFDRRLILKIGPQDESLCSIFCLAYARAILDNDYSSNPYDYYDVGEDIVLHAHWQGEDVTVCVADEDAGVGVGVGADGSFHLA